MHIKNHFPVICFIIIMTAFNLSAQNPSIIWFQTYSGEGWAGAKWVEEAGRRDDRGAPGFIMVGSTQQFVMGYEDIYLIKTDADGFVEWERIYGGDGPDIGYCVKPTMDGGYIVCGATRDIDAYKSDAYMLKTDAYGDTVWTKKYGGSRSARFYEVCQLSDGGYIAVGYIAESDGYHTDIYLVRTNTTGQLLWSREHGPADSIDRAVSIQPSNDGGFVFCGWMESPGGVDCDVQLTKVNAGGDIEWTRHYGGDRYDKGFSVARASDGGYVIAGYKTVSDRNCHCEFYLIKISDEGFVEWERTYGGARSDRALSVRQTVDGGYIMTGHSTSFGQEGNDIYVVKTDDSGNLEWHDIFGGHDDDIGECIRQVFDGNYVVTGHTEDFGGAYHDAFLMKIRPGQVGIEEELSEVAPQTFITQQNYPNPFNSTTKIRYNLHEPSDVTIIIYDLLGREVETLSRGYRPAGRHQVVWNPGDLKSGNYFYKIETDRSSETTKMILLR
ncbi:MAG: T9SS type A sorting domain-containing protein [Candidatus Zixiibacteriota bacterium]|nr:MAG: T9SS type A sorting domain-containing protein [candidate division Zixibacteria bacterium]